MRTYLCTRTWRNFGSERRFSISSATQFYAKENLISPFTRVTPEVGKGGGKTGKKGTKQTITLTGKAFLRDRSPPNISIFLISKYARVVPKFSIQKRGPSP